MMKFKVRAIFFYFFFIFIIVRGDFLYSDPSWEIQTVDSGGDVRGWGASLEFNSQDNPCISYGNLDFAGIRYAEYNGIGWEVKVVEQGLIGGGTVWWGRHTSLELDSNGYPHISYSVEPLADGYNDYINYAKYNGSGWEIQTISDSNYNANRANALKLDSSGNPQVVYSIYTGTDTILRYAKYNGSGWEIETIETCDARSISLELDSSNNPLIAYNDFTNGDLKYAHYNGTGWEIQIVDSGGDVGWDVSLEVDSNGNPHISYAQDNGVFTPTYDLKYAFYNGSGWEVQTVLTEGNAGSFTSLILDANDNPQIAFFDDTNNLVRIAIYNGSAWEYQSVESDVSVETYDEYLSWDGNFHYLSYQGNTDTDLRYAQGTPEPLSFLIFLFLFIVFYLNRNLFFKILPL